MEVLRIVLILYAIISPVVPRVPERRLYYEPSSTSDNCICYPRNEISTSVPEIIDPHNNGLVRLVVYMYKDVRTNDIKMYTPNSRKQSLIPDLPFEIGDGLTGVNGDLEDIFYNNPHSIVLDEVRNKIKDHTNSNKPVPNGDHHKSWNEENPTKIWIDKHLDGIGHQNQLDNDNPNRVIFNDHNNWNDKNPHKIVHHNIWGGDNQNGIVHNVVHHKIWAHKDPNRVVHNKVKDNMIVIPIGLKEGNIEEINHANIAIIPVSSDEEELLSIVKAHEDINNVWQGMHTTDMPLKVRPKAEPWHGDVDNEMWPVHKNFWHHMGRHWDVNSEPSEDIDADIFTLNSQNNMPLENKKYLTFDTWFVQQMRSFHSVNLPNDIDSINTMAFRSLIQKTLKENNMFVTKDGVLTDSNGNVLDASNLELRPMLLGSPVEYKQVLNGGSRDLKLPKDLPYLEGILITLVYPPKVLGIIPLGKTSLSQEFISKETKQTSVKITAIPKSGLNVASSHKDSLDTESVPRLISSSPQDMQTDEIVTKVVPERPVIKHEVFTVNKKMKNVEDDATKNRTKLKVVANDLKAEGSKPEIGNQSRRLIAGNIIKKLYDMLSDSRQGYDDGYGSDDDELFYNEDLPDFRIIGGNAATSSGAPVSTRGRSGINI